jgi:hypothetical protein
MAEIRTGKYLVRESYYQYMIHLQDDLKNTGFDWRAKLFQKSMSRYLLSDPKREQILIQIQNLLTFIIDKISGIKKAVNYTVDKNYKYLN